MNLFTGQWKITNHKRSPTEQAEKVCPFRDSCQQPPLLSLHLPGPLAVNYKIVYLNITLTYVVQKQNIEKKKHFIYDVCIYNLSVSSPRESILRNTVQCFSLD